MSSIRALLGRRPVVTAGVLIAAVALLAVAAFLGVNLLRNAGVAGASDTPMPSASPTAEPTATPGASATPQPDPTDTPAEVVYGRVFAAVVLVEDLLLRQEPVSGEVVATLDPGEMLLVFGEPQAAEGMDWYQVQHGAEAFGWVAAGPADAPFLELHREIAQQRPASVEGIAAGEAGYLVWGERSWSDLEPRARFATVSSDGITWRETALPDGLGPEDASEISVDHGPVGWILVATDATNTGTAGLWRSADGQTWEALDVPFESGLVADAVVGSPSGYALIMRDDRTGTSAAAAFSSTDATGWQEVPGIDGVSFLRGADAAGGLLLWAERPETGALIVYSSDATSWRELSGDAPVGGGPSIAVVGADAGRTLVALSVEQPSGPLHVSTAELPAPGSSGAVTWTRQPSAESELAVAAISHLVSTAAGEVLAFGTTYEAGELVAWMTSDGATWVPVQTDGLNARIGPIAAGPSGVVTTTAELSAAGWNPRLVRSADGRTWEAEPDGAQAIPRTDSAVVGACPEPPTTMVDWLAVPGAVGAECFGDAPITFVGWSTVAGGCGGFAPGIFEPDWLASMFATGPLILTPFEAEYGGCGSAAAHPTLGELPEPQQWVEVTGHWADPESASCRHRPDPQYPGAAGGGSLEFECRSRFVATQVIGAR